MVLTCLIFKTFPGQQIFKIRHGNLPKGENGKKNTGQYKIIIKTLSVKYDIYWQAESGLHIF